MADNRPGIQPRDPSLRTLSSVLANVDLRLLGEAPAVEIWPTGFPLLDQTLNGGMREGGLTLLTGPQGLGKTTFALQIARNAVVAGHAVVYFSYEHDAESMLERLIALEAGLLQEYDGPGLDKIRAIIEAGDHRDGDLVARFSEDPLALKALHTVYGYAERLVFHRSTGTTTGLDAISQAVADTREHTGLAPLVVVDYLQKVKVPGSRLEPDDKITMIVEGLKDLAIEHAAPVLAISAADKEGIATGRRMRTQHMRGSTALAYEADTVLVLNSKSDVVARHHLVYDVGNLERFRYWAVLTVEKNRYGKDHVDLEFRKRFDQSRFDAAGNHVSEQLVDDRVFTE